MVDVQVPTLARTVCSRNDRWVLGVQSAVGSNGVLKLSKVLVEPSCLPILHPPAALSMSAHSSSAPHFLTKYSSNSKPLSSADSRRATAASINLTFWVGEGIVKQFYHRKPAPIQMYRFGIQPISALKQASSSSRKACTAKNEHGSKHECKRIWRP